MHDSIREYVRANLPDRYSDVIEVGSLDVNGGVRDLILEKCWNAKYTGVDLHDGPGVDVVADFASYRHPAPADLIVCLGVLEHTEKWREILASAARNLRPAGTLIVTCATAGFAPHSANTESAPLPGEYYENVERRDFEDEISKHFDSFTSEVEVYDLRARAIAGTTWCVVVPSRSNEKTLELVGNLLRSHESIRPDQIVVVSDGLSRKTRKEISDVTIVKGKSPFIYSRAINQGVDAADPEYDIVVLGDDIRFLQRWALNRLSAVASNSSVVAPEIYGVCGQSRQTPSSRELTADWLTFNCIYIPRFIWNDVGPLDTRFTGYGYDDIDWCVRAGGRWPLLIDHHTKVAHLDRESSFREKKNITTLYEKNRAIFREKWPNIEGI